MPKSYDVLIIGSGVAGLTAALRLPRQLRIAVLSKDELHEGATLYAQGGVSAVLDAADSVENHVRDTLDAGAGLSDPEAARFVATRAADAIEWLLEHQVPFSTQPGEDGAPVLHLHREGGHSHRRIVHAADATGRAIETTLIDAVRAAPNITLLPHRVAVDLITGRKLALDHDRCLGAYVLSEASGRVEVVPARCVVLATGGASKAYRFTTNPDGSTGDGIAMAWRAGCRVTNMEFNQFHPTCLYHPKAKSFLISEAVRGEGGRLLLPDGEPFMQRFDERGELAPRDIVARAIDHEMKRLGAPCVYLDISHRPADFIREHFPTIHARCLDYGLDITREPIPVVPAAHYTCGGVHVDHRARTDVPGLYAVGETAYTGLHGANRLASNSLLECLVYARAAAEDIAAQLPELPSPPTLPPWDDSQVTDSDEQVVVSHNWAELRRFMWDYVGIVRSDKRLERAARRVELLSHEIQEYYGNFRVNADLLELRNLVVVADLIVRSARARKESRGLHYTIDHPRRAIDPPPTPTVLTPRPPAPFGHLKAGAV
ncbi:L-aspartate oxidase [Alkalilimnicola ehrlichii MLHE-1]|uniref:L-aspartate oxidase n=1 Tax=Alkalilimnicola ehrlichii (strain ATCC BAA-1101 / DSM 17681 / MLHE-1) TaxID=187272 RepID=Q0A900_ALKEH|nr:L-aspartate oxidase [Alkalilimnicola ehrlichii]ABI56687.1 L-aspartate oxidase [Alkalilimnicola ehrlichii MLHE-1]